MILFCYAFLLYVSHFILLFRYFSDKCHSDSLTISALARYFDLRCDEFLRLSWNSQHKSSYSDCFSVSNARQRGIAFESSIEKYHTSSILTDVDNEHQFLTFLRQVASQLTEIRIVHNVRFKWIYNNRILSHYRPDFLIIRRIENEKLGIEITIADAKFTSEMRIEHCVQVALYAINLSAWLKRHQLDRYVFINDMGEIWLPNEMSQPPYQRRTFPIDKLRMRLQHFLNNDLEEVLHGESVI